MTTTTAIPTLYNKMINTTTITTLQDNGDIDEEISDLFVMIMNEIDKIEKNESNDISYTKMILGLLILVALFTLKTKIYRASTCCLSKKEKKLKNVDEIPLDGITIQELNYNVTIEQT
uniref:Maco-A 34 n=1 Tax=Mamestra configurata nucleopolyhedrovirus TaxID=207830 RepID=A0A7G7Y8Z9_NPVMC|nr:maco-A 34 [Mamestra configurata nucleopolyhedrovirus A]